LKRNKTFTKKPRTKIEIKRKGTEAEKLKTKRTTQQFKGEREKKEKKEKNEAYRWKITQTPPAHATPKGKGLGDGSNNMMEGQFWPMGDTACDAENAQTPPTCSNNFSNLDIIYFLLQNYKTLNKTINNKKKINMKRQKKTLDLRHFLFNFKSI